MKRIVLFFLFLLLSVFSSTLLLQANSYATNLQAVTEEEVRSFLKDYTEAYMAMEIERFMGLFSKHAIENRMYAYNDIAKGYRWQFDRARAITYDLTVVFIKTYTRSAYVSARYLVHETPKGKGKAKIYRGNIQFLLAREKDSLKIKELNYGILED